LKLIEGGFLIPRLGEGREACLGKFAGIQKAGFEKKDLPVPSAETVVHGGMGENYPGSISKENTEAVSQGSCHEKRKYTDA